MFCFLLYLKQGVVDLFEHLPKTSHLRQPLLHFIIQHIPISLAAEWFNVHISTVKAARCLTQDQLDSGLLFVERFVADTQ